MIEIIKCPYCGFKQPYEHDDEYQLCEECVHYFEAKLDIKVYKVGSDNCKCNPQDWRDNSIHPVCDIFLGDEFYEDCCDECEHPKECHK
jgi:hypothetical protein